jgi:hypothetical protein
MNCDECHILIGEGIDDTLDAAADAALAAHLSGCAECRVVHADLQRIRSLSATLEHVSPPPSAWPRIAAGIETQSSPWWHSPSWRVWPLRRVWLRQNPPYVRRPGSAQRTRLAAAVVVTLLMAGGTWEVWRRVPSSPAPQTQASARAAANAKAAATAESEIDQAEEHYNRAIATLEQATQNDAGALDAQTTAVLQKNLGVIDSAIGESRQALHADPSNEVARQSLFDALRSKVTLLEDTVALINEMRKGNQEGAARIVSGLKP